ncbi:MAG: hypothetical protein MJK10_10770 [Pseudomonadales bacterium]|nr:hypothetical protein [Pseudomonadales bacterium]NRA16482.1 hypothetical protein [Oceanospirillaceae bacterium]
MTTKNHDLLSNTPWWRADIDFTSNIDKASVDVSAVVVAGSSYTGLSATFTLALSGR